MTHSSIQIQVVSDDMRQLKTESKTSTTQRRKVKGHSSTSIT